MSETKHLTPIEIVELARRNRAKFPEAFLVDGDRLVAQWPFVRREEVNLHPGNDEEKRATSLLLSSPALLNLLLGANALNDSLSAKVMSLRFTADERAARCTELEAALEKARTTAGAASDLLEALEALLKTAQGTYENMKAVERAKAAIGKVKGENA